MVNKATWRCRECVANGTTYNSSTASHMKSHLATHGYGPFRCTGCNYLGRRKYVLLHHVCLDNSLTLRREDIISHHRASGETGQDAGWYNDPALNARVNLEVKACRLPHRAPWTGSTAVPPPDQTALAAAKAAISPSTSEEEDDDDEDDFPMPLPGIIAQAVNAVMPMISHLRQNQNRNYWQEIEDWIQLLQIRLDRVEESQGFLQVALMLQRLGETVVMHRDLLITEREIMALDNTIDSIENLEGEANRER